MATARRLQVDSRPSRLEYPGVKPDGTPWSRETVRFARFCATYLLHTRGDWAGKPLILELWQLLYVEGLFTKRPNGTWFYRESLLLVPRKNGKSVLISALIAYALCIWGEFYPRAGIFAVANSFDQARQIVFEEVKAFLEASLLAPWLEIPKKGNHIAVPKTGAVFRVLAADRPGNLHGLNPILAVQDETHEAGKRDGVYYALRTAGGASGGKFLFVNISTAGEDKDTLLGMLYEIAKRNHQLAALGEPLADPLFHSVIYEVTDEDAQNPERWGYANPASWLTPEWLVEEYHAFAAKGGIAKFERLQGNRWVRSEDMLLPHGAYDNLVEEGSTIAKGARIFVAVDIGQQRDTTGVLAVEPVYSEEKDGTKKLVSAKFGLQKSWGAHPDPKKPRPLAHEVIQGAKVPLRLPREYVEDLCRHYEVVEVAYDPWRFTNVAEEMEDQGLPMLEFGQGHTQMVDATENLLESIYEKKIELPDDPVLKGHFESATVRSVSGKGNRLDKDKARNPMDLTVCAAMALSRAMADDGDGVNVWTPADFERIRAEREQKEKDAAEKAAAKKTKGKKDDPDDEGEAPSSSKGRRKPPEPPGRRIVYY